MKGYWKRVFIIFTFLVLLTPLGLLAPGSAWGEWGLDEIKGMIGYIPKGMNRFSEIIKPIIPDYSLPGLDKNFFQLSVGYIVSALIGIAIIVILFMVLGRFLGRNTEKNG